MQHAPKTQTVGATARLSGLEKKKHEHVVYSYSMRETLGVADIALWPAVGGFFGLAGRVIPQTRFGYAA